MEKDGACKMDRQNTVVLERVGEGRIMLELIKEENKLPGPLAKKELPAEACSRRNGKREESSWRKNISDDRRQRVKIRRGSLKRGLGEKC